MKRLLFVGAYPPPYGGIASHLSDLLPQLVKNGFDVVSLTWSDDEKITAKPLLKNIFSSPRRYFIKNTLYVLLNFLRCLRYRRDVKMNVFLKIVNYSCLINKICKEEKVDAMFIYDNQNGMVIPVLRKCFKFKIPVSFMIFGDFYLQPDLYKSSLGYISEVFSSSDFILSSSQYCADSLSKVLGFKFPVRVIYVGVDDRVYTPSVSGMALRERLQIPSSAIVFLFLGRMVKQMGLDFILENIDDFLNLNSEAYLIIAGAKGNLSEEVQKIAARNIRIKYCPDIPADQKVYYYSAGDVILAPSMERHACMGVSIKEAMACAKPVIASTSGGIPEAVEDGSNGFLIPIDSGKLDKEVFFDRMNRLISDDELRKTMGQRGYEKFLKSFTNAQTTEKYKDLLEAMFSNNLIKEEK